MPNAPQTNTTVQDILPKSILKKTIQEHLNILLFGVARIFTKNNLDYREGTPDMMIAQDEDLATDEQEMLKNVLELRNVRVDDVMVPRTEIIAVDVNMSLEDILDVFKTSQHSRLPVYQDSLDNPLGFIHVKDALSLHLDIRAGNCVKEIRDIIRNILYVPCSVPLRDLLMKMQSCHIHIALVVDEYGGTDGVLTIENLIEAIIGKINDEHDAPDLSLFLQKSEGVYEVDARLELEELLNLTGLDLMNKLSEIEIDTIGGFVTSFIGRVPQRGEIIEYFKECEFHILDSEPKHIKRIRIIYNEKQNQVDVVA